MPVFRGVRAARLFSFGVVLCCVLVFCLSCVPSVSIVYGMSILDCSFGFLQHVFTEGAWFLLGTSVSYSNKTDRHDIAEILLLIAALDTYNSDYYISIDRYAQPSVTNG